MDMLIYILEKGFCADRRKKVEILGSHSTLMIIEIIKQRTQNSHLRDGGPLLPPGKTE